MRANDLKGKSVLDVQGVEIGKLSDLGINCEKFTIENFLVSTGGFFGKKYFTVGIEDLGEINDGILLKCSGENIVDQNVDLKWKNSVYEYYFFKDFQDIYVASSDAIPVGPIKDLCISQGTGLTFEVIIEATRGKFSKNDYFRVSPEDISDIQKLILTLTKDEIKQRIKEFKSNGGLHG